jgi:hypothetical protein
MTALGEVAASVYCEAGLLPPCEVHSGDVIVWQYRGTTNDVSERCWCGLPRGRNVRKLCPRRSRQSAVQSAPMHECGTTWKERLQAVPDALGHR